MSWYDTEGKDPIFVILSETRYIRNISGIPFVGRAEQRQLEDVFARVDALLTKNGFRKETAPENDTVHYSSLAEKGFADRSFIDASSPHAIYFNEPCSLAVSLGGREHITVRALLSGRAITDSRNIASGAEELLDKKFEFAYSERFGYVSAIPSSCGSGMELSALLYLPSLKILGKKEGTRRECLTFGAILSPYLTSAENEGDLYHLSFSPLYPCDEQAAATSFDSLIGKLIEEETRSLRMIFAERSKIIIDNARRAYGTLRYASRLSHAELLSFSSSIRLALALADEDEALPPIKVTTLNVLLGEGADYSVIASCSEGCHSEEECLERRAIFTSGLLSAAD